MSDSMWTKKDVAEFLAVTEQTVDVWRRDQGLPCMCLSARCVRFDPDAVRGWARGRGAGCEMTACGVE